MPRRRKGPKPTEAAPSQQSTDSSSRNLQPPSQQSGASSTQDTPSLYSEPLASSAREPASQQPTVLPTPSQASASQKPALASVISQHSVWNELLTAQVDSSHEDATSAIIDVNPAPAQPAAAPVHRPAPQSYRHVEYILNPQCTHRLPATSHAPTSGFGNTLPPVFCCPSIHLMEPFTTTDAIKQRCTEHQHIIEANLAALPEKIRVADVVLRASEAKEQKNMVNSKPRYLDEKQRKKDAKELSRLKGDVIFNNWDLEQTKTLLDDHVAKHGDHDGDLTQFVIWGSSTNSPEKGSPGPHKQVFQVTEDLTAHRDPSKPEMRNMTLHTRLYTPLANGSGYYEILSGQDRTSYQPHRIQLGAKLVCEEHDTRYFLCLYTSDNAGQDERPVEGGMIAFETGAGVSNTDVEVWLARRAWGSDGLEGNSFPGVLGVNDIRDAAKRALGLR